MDKRNNSRLALPDFFNPDEAGKVRKVDYEKIAGKASKYAINNSIKPSASDKYKICLLAVDMQNTFCAPGYELFVSGRSGNGAVEDTKRLCEFIYKNLDIITEIIPTMDTHQPLQIFHSIFLVNEKGEHPSPYTLISADDVEKGLWKTNPAVNDFLNMEEGQAESFLLHYTKKLKEGGKYNLTVWPYHAMLGGIGYALASSFEETVFFHSIARCCQPDIQLKGNNPLSEHYSVFGPEVKERVDGKKIASKNTQLINKLMDYDVIIITGEAKSHCVAWTIDDLLRDFLLNKKHLTQKVYLLEDCTSPVVIPGVIDYTDEADKAFKKFAAAGMHIVHSTDPIESWPGIQL
ncbi:MAG: cysteine hydrolase family protein [Ignavibacteriaceae bacterium]|nr:cysteine hydrolase family protein [Ignavibacteriaceae bacterium]